jgi:4-amino-4-deoxy-L-arabinose transferase-like glycosyltransferase
MQMGSQKIFTLKMLLLIVVSVTMLSSIYFVFNSAIKEWDESRNGVNAYEMMLNKNYLTLYFEKSIDTWNAKPPLFTWFILICYKIFGLNTFSLRLPSLLASVFFFLSFFHFLKKQCNFEIATFTILVLLTCKAILWDHIGLTGDYDGLLLLFVGLHTIHLFQFNESRKIKHLILSSIFLGLGFYTKGFAAFMITPFVLLYFFIDKNSFIYSNPPPLRILIVNKLVVIGFVLSWIIISLNYIDYPIKSHYNSANQLETMLYHDIFQRLFSSNFENKQTHHSLLFFFTATDIRMNIWNYFFIAFTVINLFKINIPNDAKIKSILILSYIIIYPIAIFLSFTSTQHNWYLAPVFPFMAIVIAINVFILVSKSKFYYFILFLILFLSIRHNFHLLERRNEVQVTGKYKPSTYDENIYYTNINQKVLLFLIYNEYNPIKSNDSILSLKSKNVLLSDQLFSNRSFTKIGSIDQYWIYLKN